MIPKEKYITVGVDKLVCVTPQMIRKHHTDDEVERFDKWIDGQTCTMLERSDVPDPDNYPEGEPICGVYVWDYERWLRQGKLTNQLSHDWD